MEDHFYIREQIIPLYCLSLTPSKVVPELYRSHPNPDLDKKKYINIKIKNITRAVIVNVSYPPAQREYQQHCSHLFISC